MLKKHPIPFLLIITRDQATLEQLLFSVVSFPHVTNEKDCHPVYCTFSHFSLFCLIWNRHRSGVINGSYSREFAFNSDPTPMTMTKMNSFAVHFLCRLRFQACI